MDYCKIAGSRFTNIALGSGAIARRGKLRLACALPTDFGLKRSGFFRHDRLRSVHRKAVYRSLLSRP
jgi:hypothetical protein